MQMKIFQCWDAKVFNACAFSQMKTNAFQGDEIGIRLICGKLDCGHSLHQCGTQSRQAHFRIQRKTLHDIHCHRDWICKLFGHLRFHLCRMSQNRDPWNSNFGGWDMEVVHGHNDSRLCRSRHNKFVAFPNIPLLLQSTLTKANENCITQSIASAIHWRPFPRVWQRGDILVWNSEKLRSWHHCNQ